MNDQDPGRCLRLKSDTMIGEAFEMTKPNRVLRSWGGLLAWGGGLLLLVLALEFFQGQIRETMEACIRIAPLIALVFLFCIARELERIRELLEDRLPPDRLRESFHQFAESLNEHPIEPPGRRAP